MNAVLDVVSQLAMLRALARPQILVDACVGTLILWERRQVNPGRVIELAKVKNTAAIRVFALSYYRAAATEAGHASSGHGLIYAARRRVRRGAPRSP